MSEKKTEDSYGVNLSVVSKDFFVDFNNIKGMDDWPDGLSFEGGGFWKSSMPDDDDDGWRGRDRTRRPVDRSGK